MLRLFLEKLGFSGESWRLTAGKKQVHRGRRKKVLAKGRRALLTNVYMNELHWDMRLSDKTIAALTRLPNLRQGEQLAKR
jgi:hypothetical protein